MNQVLVQDVVAEVMRRLGDRGEGAKRETPPRRSYASNRHGVFDNVDDAVLAAGEAQKKLMRLSLEDRDAIVKLVKSIAAQNAQSWGRMELEETGIGRLDHKIEKLKILELVPGVEFLKTNAFSGSHGMCVEEFAPFGVLGVVTPVTHSIPTLTSNVISMVAAGNSLVCNPHPGGARCAAHAVREYNKAIAAKWGIDALVACILPPTLETAQQIFNHRGIDLLVVTGGAVVARAALAARKRAIVAGPGNPPVVVDETAGLENAAESIVKGAAYDNNLLCIGEKEVFCVDAVFDKLMALMPSHGAVVLTAAQIEALTKAALPVDPKDNQAHPHKDFVGKDASVLAQAAGVRVPTGTQLLVGQTDAAHPFVGVEQMMPFVPFVRARDTAHAIEMAIEAEHGYGHTALIHSRDLQTITRYGREAAVTLFVVNGPSMAGLGLGGQGYLSYSIATPTGEGVTNPLTFTRYRRAMMTGSMRFI